MRNVFFTLLIFLSAHAFCQTIHPDILQKKWKAHWIAVPNQPANDYGIYRFRKTFDLAQKPSSFIIHVSADNRYKLYVNNTLVSLGPARGDMFNWNFETIDISPYLEAGKNVVTATVWNFGKYRPEAQISYRTALIVQGNSAPEEVLNTNQTWKCTRDESYNVLTPNLIYTFYVSGPGEQIDFHKQLGGWQSYDYNDQAWLASQELHNGLPKGVFEWSEGIWMLVPRTIPAMEQKAQRFEHIRKDGGLSLPKNFPAVKGAVVIPENKKITLLLDQGYLTNAYPVFTFSKGKNAVITLSYAEALYTIEDTPDWRAQHQKGNRNIVEGKRFVGVSDQLIGNGEANQTFTSLWWRTFRYVQIEIETKNQSLVIEDFSSLFTGYPFDLKASFNVKDPSLNKILEVGWRTARLCAVETYMDCPYYEQLQYIGDTRIQALVSLFNSGDDKLMRNAITQLDYSRMPEGITLSRYPTIHAQQIPTFSLWWIAMLHDYWMYRPDTLFVKEKLAGARQILNFFEGYQQPDGSLKNSPYWEFTDWAEAEGWYRGIAPVGTDGSSAALDLQLCQAYQLAAQLEERLGMKAFATLYNERAEKLKHIIKSKYWSASKKLFADTAEKNLFSQHTNTLAILTEVITGEEAKNLADQILTNKELTPATIYFKYYVHQAIAKVGYGNQYLDLLGDWRNQLANGLTTWAETSDYNNSRSDCHAWGSSPNIEFYRIVLGIDSDSPGFKSVKIKPHLGKLTQAEGKIPHPNGEIAVRYYQIKGKWKAEITLPANTTGTFVWEGKEHILKEGGTTSLSM